MKKYLNMEMADGVEIVPITTQELAIIRPLLQQIAQDKYRAAKSNGQANLSDDEIYGERPGYETLVQFIPEEGLDAVVKIEVFLVSETLLA